MMDFLLNPNLAYLLLAGGLMMTIFALLSPGTGLLEIGALFALLLAGWVMITVPINFWALAIVLAGMVLFVLAIRWPKQWIYLAASILALVLGSAFLFRGEEWWIPAVDPFLAVIVSVSSAVILWIVARKSLEARLIRPTHDLAALQGAVGEAKTSVHENGSVQVAGELWSARSAEPIPSGKLVRVVGREGFTLEVVAIEEPTE